MNCAEAHELLLEADIAELRGEGSSPLALHLASCADCRALAEQILETNRVLGGALDRMAGRRAKGRVRWVRLVPLGLAAAAAATLIVVTRNGNESGQMAHVTAAALPPPALEVSVTGRNAAVFKTADPNITVVWFF